MIKIISFLICYIGILCALIANKCWITLAIIFIVGFMFFGYALKTAEMCPQDLNDIYD